MSLRILGLLVAGILWLAPGAALPTYAQKYNTDTKNESPAKYGIKSKKALKAYLNARVAVGYKGWDEALGYLKEALKLEPNFAEALYLQGNCLVMKKQFKEAITPLEKALQLKKDKLPLAAFFLGEAAFYTQQYQKAIDAYPLFLGLPNAASDYVPTAEKNLKKAKFALYASQNPVMFNPVNLGDGINSVGEDYMPCLTADENTLFFTSRRNGNTGGYSSLLQDFDEDFYYAQKVDGKWQQAQNLGAPINTTENEGAASITADAKFVFFTGINRPDGYGSCDLYLARFNGLEWSEPKNLGEPVNSNAWESHACLSPDGKRLYFSSNRKGTLGGNDIWYSEWDGQKWGMPVNLGPTINTPGQEYYPFVHADGRTLYFSSNYHEGFGGLDLFMSTWDGTQWTAPKNLGSPLNTVDEEHSIFVSASGKKGYINSTRPGGYGKNDIYEFDLDPKIQPLPATFLRGIVIDSVTRKPVGAQVLLVNLATGDTLRNVYSSTVDGKFMLSLPVQNDYAASVSANGYAFYSRHFSAAEMSNGKYFDMTIELQPLEVGTVVLLKNIFFDVDKYVLKDESFVELATLLKLLTQHPTMRIELRGHTDSDGTEEHNLTLSDNRAKAVVDYLVSKGIDPKRLQWRGYGESAPVAPNDTPEGKAQNRRTEFVILSL